MVDGQGWLKVPTAAAYADVSPRTLREYLKGGLRHVRLPSGLILTKREWVDSYLEKFSDEKDQVRDLVDEVIGEIRAEGR